jgi:hypothetical protein
MAPIVLSEGILVGTFFPEGGGSGGSSSSKEGHSCCGCCCDMRRATIIVNIVMIILTALHIVALNVPLEGDEAEAPTLPVPLGCSTTLAIAAYGLGIYGALIFMPWMVLVSLLSYTVLFVMSAIQGDIGVMCFAGFFAYPHVVFLKELKEGVMSRDNYHNEIQSCCCV